MPTEIDKSPIKTTNYVQQPGHIIYTNSVIIEYKSGGRVYRIHYRTCEWNSETEEKQWLCENDAYRVNVLVDSWWSDRQDLTTECHQQHSSQYQV